MSNVFKISIFAFGFYTLFFFQSWAQISEEIEQFFVVHSRSYFSLDNINGKVKINSWQKSAIKVKAKIIAETQASRDKITIQIKQLGQKVSVYTDHKDKSYQLKNADVARVDYDVWLPAQTKLANITLVNGTLIIEKIAGDLIAEIVNGSFKANGLRGNSDISSVNASVKVVYDDITSGLDDIALKTVNGSIKLALPENINANVHADTMYGTIKTAFALQTKNNRLFGNTLDGASGQGGAKVNLTSIAGDIELLKSE